jgi:ATP-dependent DNA helicase RecQ
MPPPGEIPANSPEDILHTVFGFREFRGLQAPAVHHVMQGGDALVLMPTGGGKSVCYQIPALCRPGLGLVVSPLIALMDDQVAALRQLGVSAGALHSELEPEENMRVFNLLSSGKLDLLYVSPERLLSAGTLDLLRRTKIGVIAIDEAHCVSAWGHEFRPEYRSLRRLAEIFPGVPRMALTATADPRTRDDILAALNMPDARIFIASFHRPNLNITAAEKTDDTGQTLAFLKRHEGQAGIVYCGSRKKTEETAAILKRRGLQAVAFHAGLSPIEKRAGLARFRAGEPVIMVATIAFGMGIDRPDVRFVAHVDMPGSPEAYYQQIGRAGRDGEPAETLLLHGGGDIARANYWLAQSTAPDDQLAVMRQRLDAMIRIARAPSCRTRALLSCFGENMPQDCGHCDNCRSPRALFDGTEVAQKALSAIYRTGQMFGAGYVVDVLRGAKTAKVENNKHDKLALFGIGREKSADFWRGVLRQLEAHGALRVKGGEYAGLELVDAAARPILRGETRLMLHEEPVTTKLSRTRKARAARREGFAEPDPIAHAADMATPAWNAEEGGPVSETLFDALRNWRLNTAKAQGLPPYVIFHDTVLRDIAAVRPATREALGEIRGMGASKLDRYADAVLAIVARSA